MAVRRDFDRRSMTEAGVIMILATALFGVTFTFDDVPEILAQGIQPTVFPRIVLAIIFGLAALQFWRAFNLPREAGAGHVPATGVPTIVLKTSAALVCFFVLMPTIGTFPTLILFCPVLAILWGERRWVLMAASFAGFIGFIYLLFRVAMNVPLP